MRLKPIFYLQGCKYITASRHYLQIHKKGRHGNERPHVCEFCGKGFKLPSALVTHLNIHTNSKIFKCEECDLTFNQKGGLDVSMVISAFMEVYGYTMIWLPFLQGRQFQLKGTFSGQATLP